VVREGNVETRTCSSHLGNLCMVYAAELLAILYATEAIREIQPVKLVRIFSESLSALTALNSSNTTSSIVWECYNALNDVKKTSFVELWWVSAHSNYEGNERADELAKIASLIDFCGLEPVVPISRTTVNTAIVDWASNKLAAQWKETSMCRQKKMLLPVADTKVSKACLKRSKKSSRLLTHLVTGHNLLNYHQSK